MNLIICKTIYPAKGRKQLILIFLITIILSACSASVPSASQQNDFGKIVFVDTCAACHGPKGEGYANELNAPALNASEHAWHHPDQEICSWILNGKMGISGQMPPLGDRLSNEEVQAVIGYVHSLWEPDQLATQQNLTARWPSPLEIGCSSK